MGRGRLAPVVLFLHTENYHGGETPPLLSSKQHWDARLYLGEVFEEWCGHQRLFDFVVAE